MENCEVRPKALAPEIIQHLENIVLNMAAGRNAFATLRILGAVLSLKDIGRYGEVAELLKAPPQLATGLHANKHIHAAIAHAARRRASSLAGS